jgi:hypothetical protein
LPPPPLLSDTGNPGPPVGAAILLPPLLHRARSSGTAAPRPRALSQGSVPYSSASLNGSRSRHCNPCCPLLQFRSREPATVAPRPAGAPCPPLRITRHP